MEALRTKVAPPSKSSGPVKHQMFGQEAGKDHLPPPLHKREAFRAAIWTAETARVLGMTQREWMIFYGISTLLSRSVVAEERYPGRGGRCRGSEGKRCSTQSTPPRVLLAPCTRPSAQTGTATAPQGLCVTRQQVAHDVREESGGQPKGSPSVPHWVAEKITPIGQK